VVGVETRGAVGKAARVSTCGPTTETAQVRMIVHESGVYPQFHTLYGYY